MYKPIKPGMLYGKGASKFSRRSNTHQRMNVISGENFLLLKTKRDMLMCEKPRVSILVGSLYENLYIKIFISDLCFFYFVS